MQNKTVRVIQPRVEYDPGKLNQALIKKKVCAYVRVSTENEEQKSSYEAQRDEYTKRIQEKTEWEFVGIYADEGISGTSTKNRKEFNRMIEKARQGEIDIILTKSISRFARNTVDALNFIRELRKINVEVFFEKENISSLDPKVEFLLTIMSSIAQEEARNVSENVKWNVQKRFREGIPVINATRFLGYKKDRKGGNLIVSPQEAETIKLIFKLYLSGLGPHKIAHQLTEIGALTGARNTKWHESTVTAILKNEKYCGDLVQQKTISIDYLNHTRVKNKDIAPKFHTENSHEAIIDRDTFQMAQRLREERRASRIGENKNLAKYHNLYPFSAMIICKQCGRTLKRRYWNYGTPAQRVMQQCGGYIEGKANCTAKAINQEVIEGATLQVLNEVFLKNVNIVDTIRKVVKNTIRVDDFSAKIESLEKEIGELETAMSILVDVKVKNPTLNDSIFNSKYQELATKHKEASEVLTTLELEHANVFNTHTRLKKIEDYLASDQGFITELDSDTFRSFVTKMISISPSEIVYCVTGSRNYTDKEFAEKREEFSKLEPIASGRYYSKKYEKEMTYKVVVI